MAQLVVDDRVVLWDRRRDLVYDDAGVREKWGVAPTSIPDWLGPRRRFVRRLPGHPRLGRQVRGGRPAALRPLRGDPAQGLGLGGARGSAGRGRCRLAASLRDHWDEALLYRDLARLRSVDDGVPIRQTDPDELRWDGAPRAEWEAFCEEWGLDRLRSRPHRWLAED